jgi:hypothetical protein
MAGLEVQIGADKSDFDKKIKEVEKDVADLSKIKLDRIKLGLDTTEINANIKDAKKSLNDLKSTVKDTGTVIGKDFVQKTGNGGNALMQFSRIAQDAPYGIIGIGNNITATVEAFGHLKNSTGSTGSALKAMASSIMGSGGILLGVSLLTTGLTYLAQSGLSMGDVLDMVTGKFDSQKKALNELNIEAAKTAGTEIASMKALVSVSQDETLSREKRLIAVKKLQDEYPAYFGNLSREKILNGDVSIAVDDVSRALIARARASAIAGKLGELAGKRLELEEKREQAILDIKEAQKKSDADSSVYAAGLRFNLKAAVDSYKNIVEEIKSLDNQSKKYSDRENTATKESILLLKEKAKVLKEQRPAGVTPQVSGLGATVTPTGLAETGGKVLQIAKNVQGAEGMITTSMGNINVAFDTSGAHMLEILQQLNADMNELITGSIADTFSQLGTSIGEALATGGNVFAAIGTSLLQSLGKFLSEMGGMLIQYGTLAVVKGKLDLAIAAGGPLSIGAGLAAIAVGVALKAVGGAISSKAKSGGSGGSVSTGASVSSPSSSTGSSSGGSSFQGGTVVFEISGQSLIGVLGNTLDKNRRLGGSLSLG